MRPSLIIRFGSDPREPVQWLRLDDHGRAEGHPEQGSLEGAAEAARGRSTTGLLPAVDVLLTAVQVPTQSRQRLARAVPYALEEQIAGDVEEQHFALGPRLPDGATTVAVVAHGLVQRWREAAAETGLHLDQLYSEVQALPLEPEAWTLLLDGEQFLLRTGPHTGLGGDRAALRFFLAGALEEAGEQRPQRLVVYHQGVLDEADQRALDLALEVQPRPLQQDAVDLLARHLDPRQAIPLLSGPYSPAQRISANWQRWKLAAGLLAAWVLIDTAGAWIERWQLQNEYDRLHAQVVEVFQQTFPGSQRVLYPRQQMESRLQALRQQGGGAGSGLLPLLEKIGPALSGGQVQLTGLRYRGSQLEVELTTGDLQGLDRLKQRLDALGGLQVEIRSAQTEGEQVQGRLLIEVAA